MAFSGQATAEDPAAAPMGWSHSRGAPGSAASNDAAYRPVDPANCPSRSHTQPSPEPEHLTEEGPSLERMFASYRDGCIDASTCSSSPQEDEA